MKKVYIKPDISIELFDGENIVTASGYIGAEVEGNNLPDTHEFAEISWLEFIK